MSRTARVRPWIIATLFLASLPSFAAATGTRLKHPTPAGGTAEIELPVLGDRVNVIIELREPPLFAAVSSGLATSRSERQSRRVAIQSKLEDLERDVRRIHDELRGRIAATSSDAADEPRVRARFTGVLAGASMTVRRESVHRIRALRYVKAIHFEREITAHLDKSVPKIGAPEVWQRFGVRGQGVTVAVIDTGIDYEHPAFGGGFGPGSRVAGGYDTYNGDADPMDDAGHGTHVAGIIGGNGGGIVGVAPEVTLMAYKALGGSGGGTDTTILQAIERAVDPNLDGDPSDGADVVNMSLGRISGNPADPVSIAVENASATGALFCISSGNSGGFHQMSAPADAPAALAVGATDLDDQLAFFTSKGPAAGSYAIKPEIVAPGMGIVSAQRGGGTLTASGTSMAAPHVSGAAALIKALHPDWTGPDIKSALVNTAVILGNDVMAEGAGRLDVLSAAETDILASPTVLSFGLSDIDVETWSATRVVTLTNRGSADASLQAAVAGTIDGLTVTVEPQAFDLAPGASRDVVVTIGMVNAKVPFPSIGSLALAGRVTFEGSAKPIHIPWAFIKAARLVVNYAGDDPFVVYVVNESALVAVGMVAPNARRYEAIVPAGTYDVLLSPGWTSFSEPRIRLIVVESLTVNASTTVDVAPEAAAHRISFAARDVSGGPLTANSRLCRNGATIIFPSSDDRLWLAFETDSSQPILFSSMSERFKVLPVEWCMTLTASGTGNELYIGQHSMLPAVTAPVTLKIEAPEWQKLNVSLDVPPDTQRPWMRIGAVSPVWRTPRMGAAMVSARHWPYTARTWNGTVFMTPDRHPSISAAALVGLAASFPGDRSPDTLAPPFYGIEAGLIRPGPEGFTLWGSPLDVTSPPTVYVARDGKLHFSSSPSWPKTFFGEIGGFIAGYRWMGPAGEVRNIELFSSTLTLRDGDGNIVAMGDRPGPLPTAGPYRAEIVNPAAHSGEGNMRVTALFDSRRSDAMPPSLTSLRIVDANGHLFDHLRPGESGEILFSAIDIGGPFDVANPAVDALVSWRPHGTMSWRSLTVVRAGEDVGSRDDLQHDPAGALFRVPLGGDMTATGALIDLRFEIVDLSGNSLAYEVERALTVAGQRRRSIRH